ncbi:MAG: hypothetical protein P0Y52_10885 [Candidatus Brevundimonas phytovorans]|nr:hypothetical protein [Brevundimonas sp.]WEK57043.1 MAG: hypothetical protein P0Y52_10885 [Brevundimonas sp.]
MTTATLDHDQRLAAVPDLYRRLMAQPLRPLTRARLPAAGAVYVFYQEDEPVHVGSPPYLEERRMLAPSLRVSLAARVEEPGGGGVPRVSISEPAPRPGHRKPIEARWLPLTDDRDRLLLELYAAQTLGVSVSHPKVRAQLVEA